MPSTITNDFMTTLQEAEKTHRETTLAALFSPDAEMQMMTGLIPGQPVAHSAEEFWRRYLHAFSSVESRFNHVCETGEEAILEWTSDAVLLNGCPIHYCGVSILEHDGEAITRFRTYFDSAALIPNTSRSHQRYSETAGAPHIGVEACS